VLFRSRRGPGSGVERRLGKSPGFDRRRRSPRNRQQSADDSRNDALVVNQASGEAMLARSSVLSVSSKKESHRVRQMLIGLGVGAAGGLAAGAGLDSAFPCRYMDLGCVPAPNVGKWPSGKEIVTPIGACRH
jgi:hypothetical protein